MSWSESLQSLLRTVDSALFFPHALPQKWLWSLLRPGPGHTTASFGDLTHGRGVLDLLDLDPNASTHTNMISPLLHQVTLEVCDRLRPGSGNHPWLQVDAAVLVVNAVRSTRTPFMLLGDRTAPITDSFVVLLSFRAGVVVALWDEKPLEHRLSGVACQTPVLSASTGISFLNTPLCFLAPSPMTPSDLAVNCIIIRFGLSSALQPAPLPASRITFDFKPEVWLVRTAHVPPLVRCALCLGAIRER